MHKKLDRRGFSIVEVLIVIVVVAAIAASGWLAWRHDHDKKKSATSVSTSSQQSKSSSTSSNSPSDVYAGWKSYCDTASEACIKYPADWSAVPNFPGTFQNATDTIYVDYQGYDNKDQTSSDNLVVQIVDLPTSKGDLKIVGSVVDNVPGYTVYNASDVSGITIGDTAPLITGNPTFGTGITFTASPSVNEAAKISNLAEAKAWFDTADAKRCLLVLQSFSYPGD